MVLGGGAVIFIASGAVFWRLMQRSASSFAFEVKMQSRKMIFNGRVGWQW
jgi:hypothetical protein